MRPKATIDDENSELEYDETRSLDDSADSGSEFVASDDSEDAPQNFDSDENDEEDEEVMLSVAVQNSLASSRRGQGSSSSSAALSPAALRAAAAERRLARANRNVDVDDSAMLEELSGSDDESVAGHGKGKGKSKARAQSQTMTFSDLRKRRTELAQEKAAFKKLVKKEEAALRKKLGRKLTHAEKTTIALHKFHPELRDVWGDLEANIAVVVPEKAEQPQGIKLQLLPFQMESLYWMKKQEEGIWHGGMLAVSSFFLHVRYTI